MLFAILKTKDKVGKDRDLIAYTVRSYDTESGCFAFPNFSLFLGLEDIYFITGLPIDGLPVTRKETKEISRVQAALEKMFLGNFEITLKICQLMAKICFICCSSIHFIHSLINFFSGVLLHMFIVILIEDFGKINQYA